MRARVGNPFCDQHMLVDPSWSARVYDFVAMPTVAAGDIPGIANRVIPALALEASGGWANGCVYTSRRYDALYVALVLYDTACADLDCMAGHRNVVIQTAPPIPDALLEGVVEELGEHPEYRLGVGHDVEILSGFGFTLLDAPLLGIEVTEADVYRALARLNLMSKRPGNTK